MTAPPQGVEVEHVTYPAGTIRYYRAGGSGPPIVLLHGGGVDNALLSWRHAIPSLAADHQVLVPDLPRHGGSREWRGRANQRTLEELMRWLFDTWGLHDATLVGLSTGGSVATGFALRHPQRVRGLVLVGSGGLQYRLNHHLLRYAVTKLRVVGPALAGAMGLSRALTRSYLTRGVLAGTETLSDMEGLVDEVHDEVRHCRSVFVDWQADAINRRGMTVNHLPRLEQITCPTMLVHGELDREVPVAASRDAADAIAGSRLRVIQGAGHWCHRERPNEFNALLREFVNGRHEGR